MGVGEMDAGDGDGTANGVSGFDGGSDLDGFERFVIVHGGEGGSLGGGEFITHHGSDF